MSGMVAEPPTGTSLPIPSSRPLPLSAAQEQQVKDIYYARVRGYCADEIKEFARCAANRTITATWKCRTERLAMNGCMVAHASMEEQDKARAEWFATMEERRRKREEQEAERRRQKKIHHEWWGLDEDGKRKHSSESGGKGSQS